MCFFTIIIYIPPKNIINAADKPSREINLVYDDSSSMINNGANYLDRWCQAKYALEVFAAMLDEKDTMNVYAMSDFSSQDIDYSSVGPQIKLSGNSSIEENVGVIHSMLTKSLATPFQTVEKAYSDLTKSSADEKWLIVLTDGVFTKDFKTDIDISEVDNFFKDKDSKISVMYLAIGDDAMMINENPSSNIFTFSAVNSTDILNRITEMSNRIFARNRLNVDVSNRGMSFDIPMNELIVFAQGKDVLINGISRPDNSNITPNSSPVEVKYSDTAAENYRNDKNVVVNDNLVGRIAYFNSDFDAGDYTLDVSGSNTIEVYYKPNVEIAAYLVNQDGNEFVSGQEIKKGDYSIGFGFVKGGTNERIAQSELLGDVEFNAYITINGQTDGKVYHSGDQISLEEGTLSIDANATYLNYNTISTHVDYGVFDDKTISFEIVDEPIYQMAAYGIKENSPIVVQALIRGEPIPSDKWNEMSIPQINIDIPSKYNITELRIEKAKKTGTFFIYPVLENGEPAHIKYNEIFNGSLNYIQMLGNETWKGQVDFKVKFEETRRWWEIDPSLIPKLIGLLLLLLIILGYLFKNKLPKAMKTRPRIECIPTRIGVSPDTDYGRVIKKRLTYLFPFISQRAEIEFLPMSASPLPLLSVKACGRKKMRIKNLHSYSEYDDMDLNDTPVQKFNEKTPVGAGLRITVRNDGWEYICVLNKE